MSVLPIVLLVALAVHQEDSDRPARLASLLETLDRAREPGWTEAFEALVALGPGAASRVVEGFPGRDFVARRARAQLLTRLCAPELAPPVLALLGDPDPEVRRWLALLLGNPALAEAVAAERVRALVRLARDDPDALVRAQAREGLVECALPEAVLALDELIEELPSPEAGEVAAALARLPAGRERLIAQLVRPGSLAIATHVALLDAYGRALAEVPRGGEDRRERLPLLVARLHPALEVQAAARAALASFVARAAELAEVERAERALTLLGEEGWPLFECLRKRLDLAWFERGDPALALELARALARLTHALPAREAEAWEVRAALFEGAALAAGGRRAEAERHFDGLVARLQAIRGRRTDLFPDVLEGLPSAGGGSETVDRLHLLALAHLWRAYLALDTDAQRVLAELRALHAAFLESRVVALRTRADDPVTLDTLLDRDLSPYGLILFNERFLPEARDATLGRALALSRALGRVAPLELQGLGGEGADGRFASLFQDPLRLALMKSMREAWLMELQRQLDELSEWPRAEGDPDQRDRERRLYAQRIQMKQVESQEQELLAKRPPPPPERIYQQLTEYLTPSMHAHTLAGQLRGEGRAREALELCASALETLRTRPLGSSTFWNELASARFELLRGSVLMDEGRAGEAEQAYLASEVRLASLEAQVEEWRATLPDPEGLRQNLGQIRSLRGEALLALAVNANVRMGDPAKALAYFERAYELNQSPFMRILRACYRARSGKQDEARTVLASVVPVPSLYYNIACTHALLGEKEAALDYLERDVRENCPSRGSLAQKRAWAAQDPDLASLRGDARFERLLGGP